MAGALFSFTADEQGMIQKLLAQYPGPAAVLKARVAAVVDQLIPGLQGLILTEASAEEVLAGLVDRIVGQTLPDTDDPGEEGRTRGVRGGSVGAPLRGRGVAGDRPPAFGPATELTRLISRRIPMGKFQAVPVSELKGKRRLKPEDQAKFEELKGYVEGLAKGQAGIYECDPGEDPKKVRNLLRKVAGAANNPLRIQLEGSKITFIPKAEMTVVRRRKRGEGTTA